MAWRACIYRFRAASCAGTGTALGVHVATAYLLRASAKNCLELFPELSLDIFLTPPHAEIYSPFQRAAILATHFRLATSFHYQLYCNPP